MSELQVLSKLNHTPISLDLLSQDLEIQIKDINEIITELELEENQLLIYVKGKGFVIPEYRMYKANDAIELYTKALK